MAVEPGMNGHIVASLAGGTGSGRFLDMAYMARRVLQSPGIAGVHQVGG